MWRKEIWSGRRDSNPQPSAWEADALPLRHTRSDVGRRYHKSPIIRADRGLDNASPNPPNDPAI